VNEVLRRALYDAGLTELDLSVELSVDPKTVRNWLRGQVPHPRTRVSLTRLLAVDESLAWPELRASAQADRRPAELAGVYARRRAIRQQDWLLLFEGAQSEIDILTYSAVFLTEDPHILRLLDGKGRNGVRIRVALGTPHSLKIHRLGVEETMGEDLAERIRISMRRLQKLLSHGRVELRAHDAVLYNSMYRSDAQLLVNQHAQGIPAAESPVFHYHQSEHSEMFDGYLASFEAIWSEAAH
jgi:transcriptional regulator with XRE-family HTH domain